VVLGQVAHFLTLAALPLFLPLIREDLDISFTQAGIISAAGLASYTVAQVPAGWLTDRYGPRRLFCVGLFAWSLLSLTFGLVQGFWLAVANQFIAGAFRALLFAPGLALLASWFPPGRRATAMSLFLLGAAAGSVLLSLAGPLVAQHYGWRAAFIGFAAVGIGIAALFFALAREQPRGATPRAPGAAIAELARHPVMWVCCALQFVRFSVVMGFGFWLPSFLVVDRGMSIAGAGMVMAMSAALAAPSNTIGAYLSDRLRNPPVVIGAALALLACASALLPVVDSTAGLLGVIALYSMLVGSYFGPLFLVPVEVLGQRVIGTATGFANLFANIGGFTTVYALGWIRDETGSFAWGFAAIGVACVAGIALAALLARLRNDTLRNQSMERHHE
jgi:sugar phosphate permease